MKDNELRKFIIYKLSAAFMMVLSVVLICVVIKFTDMFNTSSIFYRGDIIQYNGKVIICVGGIPLFIWFFFFSLRILLHNGMKPLKKSTLIGSLWAGFSIACCCLGFVISFIIPFILMFSSYTSCNEDKLGSYYVIHPDLCKTIVPYDKLR